MHFENQNSTMDTILAGLPWIRSGFLLCGHVQCQEEQLDWVVCEDDLYVEWQ